MVGFVVVHLLLSVGEVSDSDKGSDGDIDKFDDGLDENLIGDEEDKKRLEQMTEKEREQEIFNRLEKRDAMRTRYTPKQNWIYWGISSPFPSSRVVDEERMITNGDFPSLESVPWVSLDASTQQNMNRNQLPNNL